MEMEAWSWQLQKAHSHDTYILFTGWWAIMDFLLVLELYFVIDLLLQIQIMSSSFLVYRIWWFSITS